MLERPLRRRTRTTSDDAGSARPVVLRGSGSHDAGMARSAGSASSDSDEDVNVHLKCPITGELFLDPVLLVGDGHTYERDAVERWLSEHNTSPLTGAVLSDVRLVPNFAVRGQADEVKGATGGHTYRPSNTGVPVATPVSREHASKAKGPKVVDEDAGTSATNGHPSTSAKVVDENVGTSSTPRPTTERHNTWEWLEQFEIPDQHKVRWGPGSHQSGGKEWFSKQGWDDKWPLHGAALRGDVGNIKWLLSTRARDPNEKMTDWFDSEPLGWAASFGQLEAVVELIRHGADPLRPPNLAGNTPLRDAQRECHEPVIRFLKEYAFRARSAAPIPATAIFGHVPDVVDKDVDTRQIEGPSTSRHEFWRWLEQFEIPDEHKVRSRLPGSYDSKTREWFSKQGWDDKWPLHGAAQRNDVDGIKMLLLTRARDPNEKMTDWFDSEPLGWAASQGHLEAVVELIRRGADPLRPPNLAGNTPLEDARRGGHIYVVQFLKEYAFRSRVAAPIPATAILRDTDMVAQPFWDEENWGRVLCPVYGHPENDRGAYHNPIGLCCVTFNRLEHTSERLDILKGLICLPFITAIYLLTLAHLPCCQGPGGPCGECPCREQRVSLLYAQRCPCCLTRGAAVLRRMALLRQDQAGPHEPL